MFLPYESYKLQPQNSYLRPKLQQLRKLVLDGTFDPASVPVVTRAAAHAKIYGVPEGGKRSCKCRGGKRGPNCGCRRNSEKCNSSCSCNGNCAGSGAMDLKISKFQIRAARKAAWACLVSFPYYVETQSQLKWFHETSTRKLPCIVLAEDERKGHMTHLLFGVSKRYKNRKKFWDQRKQRER